LRAKLGPEHEQLIGTVRNVGYKFVRPGRNGLSSRGSDQDLDQEGDQIPRLTARPTDRRTDREPASVGVAPIILRFPA
jgi:DNA-binding winged helix-turn-helix (wHTH) protein